MVENILLDKRIAPVHKAYKQSNFDAALKELPDWNLINMGE
jgi:hypothetical protein